MQLMTIEQVACLLKVSYRTVAAMVARGDFPAPLKVANRSLWRAATVEAFLAGRESRVQPIMGEAR